MNGHVADPSCGEADAGLRPQVPLWLLSLFVFSGTLAIHIFLPALPLAAADLGAGVGAMQLTVSLYIFGLAIGQLAYGPVSDRFGRRPTLMAGLAIYAASGMPACSRPSAAVPGWSSRAP